MKQDKNTGSCIKASFCCFLINDTLLMTLPVDLHSVYLPNKSLLNDLSP